MYRVYQSRRENIEIIVLKASNIHCSGNKINLPRSRFQQKAERGGSLCNLSANSAGRGAANPLKNSVHQSLNSGSVAICFWKCLWTYRAFLRECLFSHHARRHCDDIDVPHLELIHTNRLEWVIEELP